jgi:hypothetical protein
MNRSRVVGMTAVVGGACVIAAAVLPWLTVFHGLRSYSGIEGPNGRVLLVGGIVGALLGIWYGIRPQPSVRYAIGAIGFVLAIFTGYLLAQLLVVYRELEHMYLPAIGPGLVIAAAGNLLLISTLLVRIEAHVREELPAGIDARAAALIALSAGAGTIHLAVAAEHYREFPLYGVFFVLLGIAQLGWAAAVALKGFSWLLLLAALANWPVPVLWVVSRTSGVPIGPAPWVPESVGLAGIASTVFQVVLVGWAMWVLGRPRRSWHGLERVGWALPLTVAVATITAILLDVGGHA